MVPVVYTCPLVFCVAFIFDSQSPFIYLLLLFSCHALALAASLVWLWRQECVLEKKAAAAAAAVTGRGNKRPKLMVKYSNSGWQQASRQCKARDKRKERGSCNLTATVSHFGLCFFLLAVYSWHLMWLIPTAVSRRSRAQCSLTAGTSPVCTLSA